LSTTRWKLRGEVFIIEAYVPSSAVLRLTVTWSQVSASSSRMSGRSRTALVVTFSIGRPLDRIARRKSRMRRWKRGSPPPERRRECVPASRSSPSISSKRVIGTSSVPRSDAVEQKKQSMLHRSAGWISTWYGPP
jgi:hypothetical protein